MKKNMKFLIIGIVFVLIIAIGGSVAYWVANIQRTRSGIVVNVDNLKIIFTDNDIIDDQDIRLGWEKSKDFSVENQSNQVIKYNINLEELINTLVTDGLEFKITSSDTDAYNMKDFESIQHCDSECVQVLKKEVSIGAGETHNYTITFRYRDIKNIDQGLDMGKRFSGKLSITEFLPNTPSNLFASKYASAGKRDDFSNIVTEGNVYVEDGNFTENGKKVYYFAGNSTDNWVKFGNYYWRIIRLNEDGGLRLLYAGENPESQTAYIMDSGNIGSDGGFAYNEDNYGHTAYVGYMYSTGDTLEAIRGNETPSPIMTELEKWYTENLETNYDKYISKTAIYCNDRSTYGEKTSEWASSGTMYYNGYRKFVTNKADNAKNHPSFKCGVGGDGKANYDSPDAERKKDMFSVSQASGGNGALTKPIGLMTADEVVFAGGFYGTNNESAYYYRNASGGSATGANWWWTMSPSSFFGGSAYVFIVDGSSNAGRLSRGGVYNSDGVVRPVISLKSCVQLSGTGKSGDPYTVTSDSSCDALEN